MQKYFENKLAVITGGSSGLGLAFAHELSALGASVVILSKNNKKLKSVLPGIRDRARSPSQKFAAFPADVTDYSEIKKTFNSIQHEQAEIDFLFNLVEKGAPGFAHTLPLRSYRNLLETNFMGTVHCVKAVLPHMTSLGQGHILNVGCASSLVDLPGNSAFRASKLAVQGYTESLRSELSPRGIKVSLLCPPDAATLRPARSLARAGTSSSRQAALISPEAVARATLEDMARGSFLIVPCTKSAFARLIARLRETRSGAAN